ncbi:MAG: diaminopimelate epimerase [Pseudomonadota bacterium]|nr:diaminopimelate epimerase [Pseudomonadota bacterium]
MLLQFTKMHGAGNDFVVLDLVTQQLALTPTQIRQLANRRTGIGFDQLLLVEPPQDPDADFRYRIYNADGNEVEQCGNGARCFARFVRDHKLSWKDHLRVETAGGLIELQLERDGRVRVDMGAPVFAPERIPFLVDAEADSYQMECAGEAIEFAALSMGNPHAVIEVPAVDSARVAEIGAALNNDPRFPAGINVGFMQIERPERIRLRVYERGVGETLACGTGACAAVVAGIRWGRLAPKVEVRLPGGRLHIRWDGAGEHVHMVGPATRVFEGQIQI